MRSDFTSPTAIPAFCFQIENRASAFIRRELVNEDETPGHDGEVHELLLMGNSLNFHIADTRKYP
jgi:hypothetical protein